MDAWDRMTSWELVLPPSRPSQQHLDWFRKHLGELQQDDPIAILGSTPELRDLLAQFQSPGHTPRIIATLSPLVSPPTPA